VDQDFPSRLSSTDPHPDSMEEAIV
jgi:hypothetical protein